VDILREHLSVDSTFYNFSSREGTIDARFRGNKARFINHDDQGRENLYAKDVLSGGRFKVALFAKRDIDPH
jgi:SET domain-containing protein